jgi:hypothetical protein
VVTLSATPPAHIGDGTHANIIANWDDSGAKQRRALNGSLSGTALTLSDGTGDALPTGDHAILIAFERSRVPDIEASGSLTTRTDNTDGTVTLTAPHQIQVGNIASIYTITWSGGSRTGVTGDRGTGANSNVLAISGGSGDNLPAQDTAVTVSYMYIGLRDLTGGTGQTITVTDNPGAATLSDAEKALATNKNWTVTA